MANLTHFLECTMRTRYVVINNGEREGFTKPSIDAMKRLGLITFIGTVRTNDARLYKYTARDKRFK